MTVEERIKTLTECEEHEYLNARLEINEEFIDMIKTIFPEEWIKLKPREEQYQNVLRVLSEIVQNPTRNSINLSDPKMLGHHGC
jgi:hypothetical protein